MRGVERAQEGKRVEEVEEGGERVIASFAYFVGVCSEASSERNEEDYAKRNESNEGNPERGRARVKGETGGEHRDDGGDKARVEAAHESADRRCVARQFGDERSVGVRHEFGRGEIHDSFENASLELHLDVPCAGEDEALKARSHDGPDEQQRGEQDKRYTRRQSADKRVDEASCRERDGDSRNCQRDKKRRIGKYNRRRRQHDRCE